MTRKIDLSLLSVPQLLEIKRILTGGVEASADAKGIARELKKQNAELQKKTDRMGVVLSEGLDLYGHEDYWLSFSDEHFAITIKKMSDAKRVTANAERHELKIPQMHFEELSGVELVRQGFKERKNGR